MRLAPNGRAGERSRRAGSFLHWNFNEQAGPCIDLIQGVGLAYRSAYISGVDAGRCHSPIGTARRFGRGEPTLLSEQAGAGDPSHPIGIGDWTCGMRFRVHTQSNGSFASLGMLFVLGAGLEQEDSSDGWIISCSLRDDGSLRVAWHDGDDTFRDFTTQRLVRPYIWHDLVIRKRNTSLNANGFPIAGPTGTCSVDVILAGEVVYTEPGFANTAEHDAACWHIGGIREDRIADGDPPALVADIDVDEFTFESGAVPIDDLRDDARRYFGFGHILGCEPKFLIEHEDPSVVVDMTDHFGIDWLDRITVDDDHDQAVMVCQTQLILEHEGLSLAQLRTDTPPNLTDLSDPTSFYPLIEEGARVEALLATPPLGIPADGRDWVSQCEGRIDDVRESDSGITIDWRCRGGDLMLAYVEQEVEYGADPPEAIEQWMQDLLDDNDNDPTNDSVSGLLERVGSYDPVTLLVPVSPAWNVLPFTARRDAVLTVLRSWVNEIAWDCRYRFSPDPFNPGWHLTLYDPVREILSSQVCIGPDEVYGERPTVRSRLGQRTNVRVTYPSSETSLPTPPALPVGYSYAEQIWNGVDGQGRRIPGAIHIQSDIALASPRATRGFMETPEIVGGQIDTVVEASTWALGMIQDLDEPDLGMEILTWPHPGFDLNTQALLPSMGRRFTAPQRLTAKKRTLTVAETATQTLQLRGKPSVGSRRWLALETRGGRARPSVLDPLAALTDSSVGSMQQVIRSILDRTQYLMGGKFLAVRNSSFSDWAGGSQTPPDGWSVESGEWGVDILRDEGLSASGKHAVRFTNSTAKLVSDLIPISGANFEPYTFSVQHQQVSGTPNTSAQLTVRWYDADENFLGEATSEPRDAVGLSTYARSSSVATIVTTAAHGFSAGDIVDVRPANVTAFAQGFRAYRVEILTVPSSTSFTYASQGVNLGASTDTAPEGGSVRGTVLRRRASVTLPVPTSSGQWFQAGVTGVEPFSGAARFIQFALQRSGSSAMLIDSVNGYRAGRAYHSTYRATGWTQSVGGWTLARYYGENPRWGGFDYGQNWKGSAFTVSSNPIGVDQYEAREDQTVTVVASFAVVSTGSLEVRLRIVKNETYAADNAPNGVGQVVILGDKHSKGGAGAPSANTAVANVTGQVQLQKGDRLNVEFFISASATATSDGDASRTFFIVKESLAD
jgi:hypothetical protein